MVILELSESIKCLFILLFIAIVGGVGTAIAIICNRHMDSRHEKELAQEKDIEIKRMQLEYSIKKLEVDSKVVKTNDPEKPKKAPESELAQWFEIMSDPDKLFDDTPAKKEA